MIKIVRLTAIAVLSLICLFSSASIALALGRVNAVKLDLLNPPRVFDTNLRDHVIRMRKKIQSMWVPPGAKPKREVRVQFLIEENGQLEDIQVTSSSGDTNFDRQAQNAVCECAPFAAWTSQSLKIEASFDSAYLSAEEYDSNRSRMQQIAQLRGQKKLAFMQATPQQIPTSNLSNTQKEDWESQPSTIDNNRSSSQDRSAPIEQVIIEREPPSENRGKWTKLLAYNQFKNITPDQQADYLSWFKQWLTLPTEQKFPFLISAQSTVAQSARQHR